MTPERQLYEIARGRLDLLPVRQPGEARRHVDLPTEAPAARVLRLLGEFMEAPDEIGLTRLISAFKNWKKSALDPRGLALEPGLAALERYGRTKIKDRERLLACGGS
jgi:hypothetical protein